MRPCIERRRGGRIFERTSGGEEHDWGEVTAFDRPRSLKYLWHIRSDRADATEVEISFHELGRDRTRVEIEHRGWERLGDGADRWRTATWPHGEACSPATARPSPRPGSEGHNVGLSTAAGADTEQIQIERALRELAPQVLGALVRRHGRFDACEDAVQEALLAASLRWPADGIPDAPRGWLIAVATRRLIDELRSERSRRAREQTEASLGVAASEVDLDRRGAQGDDTLTLLFLCCHPALTPVRSWR